MTFRWGVEAEHSLIMFSDWSQAVPFAKLNSIRGTKTCFVEHWHQRKAGRSRPTITFLFLQDSWCLHQQKCSNAINSSHVSLTQMHHSGYLTRGTLSKSLFTAVPQGHCEPPGEDTALYKAPPEQAAQRHDLPGRAQHSQPPTQAVIAPREKWTNRTGWRERVHTLL